MNIKEQFGKKLRALRMAKNMSQEKLALEAGLDRTYIPSIEQGKRNVSIEVIAKLAKALDIPMTDFFIDL
jgi:transcriptional regulator with XRE-family HTH domain